MLFYAKDLFAHAKDLQGHEVIMLYSSFVAVGVTCRSVIHSELVFEYGVIEFFSYPWIQLFQW